MLINTQNLNILKFINKLEQITPYFILVVVEKITS